MRLLKKLNELNDKMVNTPAYKERTDRMESRMDGWQDKRKANLTAMKAKAAESKSEHKLVTSARTEARDAWDRGAPVFTWRSPVRSEGGDAAVAGAKAAVAIAFLPAAIFMRADPITKGGKAKQKALEDEVVDGSLNAIMESGWKIQDVKPAALGAFYTFVRSPA